MCVSGIDNNLDVLTKLGSETVKYRGSSFSWNVLVRAAVKRENRNVEALPIGRRVVKNVYYVSLKLFLLIFCDAHAGCFEPARIDFCDSQFQFGA